MKLVLVESPAKAKTINKYLGSDYDVMATIGHIRNLPNKNGVDPEENFSMQWELLRSSHCIEKFSSGSTPFLLGRFLI